jgi:hypothetical protein
VQQLLHPATKKEGKEIPMITIVALAGLPRFPLGRIVSTPGTLEACSPEYLAQCLTQALSR